MRFKHRTLIILAGLVWVAIGALLLSLGIHFILEALRHPELAYIPGRFSVLAFFDRYVSDRANAVILVVTVALMIGYFKGKMVLSKSVHRQIRRIESLPNPGPLKHLYSKGYYMLIAGMILLGVSLRFWPITVDTRGAIDLAIGSALINGAMLYFRVLARQAYLEKKGNPSL